MEENDNTVQPDVQAAPQEGQPASEDVAPETLDQPAVSEPSDAPQASDEPEAQAAPAVDDELQKFAKSQGLELDSPNAIKAAQALQKARSEATRNYQKASELEKATNITQEQIPQDAPQSTVDAARIRNMELKMEVQSWKMSNQDKLALEPEMIKILADPNKKLLVQEGYLSLDDVYKLARAEAPDNSAAVKSEGKREALQSLAHKQQAAVPTGHATNQGTSPKQKDFKELSLEEMEARLGYAPR